LFQHTNISIKLWTWSKPAFREPSLSLSESHFPDDDDRDSSRNIGLLVIQPPDAAASPSKFHCIRSPWKLHIKQRANFYVFTSFMIMLHLLCCTCVEC